MKTFKTKYDISYFNWVMITANGFDLSYLKVKRNSVKEKEYKKLYKIYVIILDSLGEKFELLDKFLKWKTLLTQFRSEVITKKSKSLKGEDYNFNIKDLEKVFRNYLNTIDNHFTDFELTEYYFDKTQKEKFKELTGKWFKELDNFDNVKFFDARQYEFFCNKYPDFKMLTMSESFVKLFIKQRTVKVLNLIDLDVMLSDLFVMNGKYNEYQFIRMKLFNFNQLKSKLKQEQGAFEELAMINTILGTSYAPENIKLSYFEGLRETARKKNEQIKATQNNG